MVGAADRVTRRSVALLIGLAALSTALFALAVSRRFAFPYELTSVEAAQPLTVKRLLDGLPLYTRPTWQYVGPFYTPLSFLIEAGLARIFGLSLPLLRVVSILSTVGTVAIVYAVLRDSQAPRSIAIVCAAMLFAAHTRLGEILDIARVDAPEMLFAVLGLAAVERSTRPGATESRWTTVAAVALAAAVLTKQTALTVPAGACLGLLSAGRTRTAVRLGVLVTGIVAACGVALHVASDGWSTFYFIEMPASQTISWRHFALSVGRLAFFFPAALACCVVVIRRFWRRASLEVSVWEASLGLSILGALFANAKVGGSDNVWAVVVPLAAVAMGKYWATSVPALSPRHLLFYPIVWQVAVLPHRPIVNMPTAVDVHAYQTLVADLHRLPRPLFNPMFPYESTLVGAEPSATWGQINDFLPNTRVRKELAAAFEGRRFAAVVAGTWDDPVFAGLENAYPEATTWTTPGLWSWDAVRVFIRAPVR